MAGRTTSDAVRNLRIGHPKSRSAGIEDEELARLAEGIAPLALQARCSLW